MLMAMDKSNSSRTVRKWRSLMPKKPVVAVVAIVLVVLGGVFLWRSIDTRHKQAADEPVMSLADIQSEVSHFSAKGDTDGALRFYDTQIIAHTAKADKASIYIAKSEFCLSIGKQDEAIEAVKRADQLASTNKTLVALAQAYEMKGDKKQALFYYKKVRDMYPPTEESRLHGRPSTLDDKIRELEK